MVGAKSGGAMEMRKKKQMGGAKNVTFEDIACPAAVDGDGDKYKDAKCIKVNDKSIAFKTVKNCNETDTNSCVQITKFKANDKPKRRLWGIWQKPETLPQSGLSNANPIVPTKYIDEGLKNNLVDSIDKFNKTKDKKDVEFVNASAENILSYLENIEDFKTISPKLKEGLKTAIDLDRATTVDLKTTNSKVLEYLSTIFGMDVLKKGGYNKSLTLSKKKYKSLPIYLGPRNGEYVKVEGRTISLSVYKKRKTKLPVKAVKATVRAVRKSKDAVDKLPKSKSKPKPKPKKSQ